VFLIQSVANSNNAGEYPESEARVRAKERGNISFLFKQLPPE
jgi:hypothetical protein